MTLVKLGSSGAPPVQNLKKERKLFEDLKKKKKQTNDKMSSSSQAN